MSDEKVFLSYGRQDTAYVQDLHNRLEAEQVEVWWDQKQPSGCDWSEQLFTWVTSADAVVVIVSQHSTKSLWVKNEVYVALRYERRVIPVMLEHAAGGLLMLIASLQWIDVRDGHDPVPEILHVLRGDTGGPPCRGLYDTLIFELPREPSSMPRSQPSTRSTISSVAMGDQLPPPAATKTRAQITIVFPGDIRDFDEREQEGLIQLLARFANVSPKEIMVMQIEAGSVRVTLELPESTARWLVSLYRRNKPLIALLDILAIDNFRVVQPEPVSQPVSPPLRGQWRLPTMNWRRLMTPALALAAVLLLAWGLAQLRIASKEAEDRAIAVAVHGDTDAKEYKLDPTSAAPGAKGQVWLSPGKGAVALYTKNLPQAPAGKVYHLWLQQDSKPISVLTFQVDQDGRTWNLFRLDQTLPQPPQRAFVTLEPAGDNPQSPGLEVYLQGNVEE